MGNWGGEEIGGGGRGRRGEGEREIRASQEGEAGTWEQLASAHQWGSEFKTTLKIAAPWPSSPCLVLSCFESYALEYP